ncbi:hypothetical protein BBJ28_00011528 [Nothophytophthora sp. Chile5]|nr:hypothetical protein BBJ28_00011528 [Nothophytophthora sp. Chile5]
MSVNFNQFYVPAPLAAASSASPSSDSSSSGSSASLSSPDVRSGRHRAPLSQALANYVSFPFPFVKKPKLRKNPNGKTGNGDKGKSKIPRDGQQQCQASGQRLHGGATPLVGEHWRKTPTGAYVPLTLLELSVRNICTQLLMDQPDVLQGALPTELATSVLQWLRQHHALGKTQFQILAPFLLYEWNLAGQTDVEDSWFDDLPSTPLQHVKNIDVSGCHRLQQLGSEWGRPVVELPSLTIACFQDCTKLSCDSIEMLQFSTKLTQLNLSGCSSVNDGCLKALRGLVHLKSLELVRLIVVDRILQIGQLMSLQVLVIRGCQDIGDDGMRSLAGLTELTYFDARHCGQVHSIPTEWRQLQVLLLGYTAFAESDAAVLQHLLNLRELELRKCRILKRGFQFISRLPKLERLGLAETALTDAGLLEICNGIPYLRALNISNTEISDAGAVGLAKLKELRILRMDAPGITNRALANLSFLSRLERLDLFGAK